MLKRLCLTIDFSLLLSFLKTEVQIFNFNVVTYLLFIRLGLIINYNYAAQSPAPQPDLIRKSFSNSNSDRLKFKLHKVAKVAFKNRCSSSSFPFAFFLQFRSFKI